MNAYIMAAISFLSNKSLDLTYIWENQRVQQEVVDKIEELIPLVWNHLTGSSASGAQSSNINEWSKKPECWNRLKLKPEDYERFGDDLMQPETNEDGSSLNETQRSRIKEADEFDPNFWFGLANWAKTRNLLSPLERKAAFNFGTISQPVDELTETGTVRLEDCRKGEGTWLHWIISWQQNAKEVRKKRCGLLSPPAK